MRPRAIRDLASRSDSEFFAFVSEGLEIVIRNAARLHADAQALVASEKYVSARVLWNVSREETAKALILIDAVRCPRIPQEKLSKQLARFSKHLEKGLYAEAYDIARTRLCDIQHFLDLSRREYYLDGPNDVDWIFRNSILDDRERSMYADFEETDVGHRWSDPAESPRECLPEFSALRVVTTLLEVGACTAPALEIIAKIWRRVTFGLTDEIQSDQNIQMLKALDENGLLLRDKLTEEKARILVHDWKLPLIDLELDKIDVEIKDLRNQQQNWDPSGGYYQ